MKKVLIALVLFLLPFGLANASIESLRSCKAVITNPQIGPSITRYSGTDGWKFVNITLNKKSSADVLNYDSIIIENKPNTTPLFTTNYVFSKDVVTAKSDYKGPVSTKFIEADLKIENGFVTVEVDGIRIQISHESHGRLYFLATMKNSNLVVSEAFLTPSSH